MTMCLEDKRVWKLFENFSNYILMLILFCITYNNKFLIVIDSVFMLVHCFYLFYFFLYYIIKPFTKLIDAIIN